MDTGYSLDWIPVLAWQQVQELEGIRDEKVAQLRSTQTELCGRKEELEALESNLGEKKQTLTALEKQLKVYYTTSHL